MELKKLRESILNGRSIGQRSLDELKKIRKEAKDSTRISWISIVISVVALIVALLR